MRVATSCFASSSLGGASGDNSIAIALRRLQICSRLVKTSNVVGAVQDESGKTKGRHF